MHAASYFRDKVTLNRIAMENFHGGSSGQAFTHTCPQLYGCCVQLCSSDLSTHIPPKGYAPLALCLPPARAVTPFASGCPPSAHSVLTHLPERIIWDEEITPLELISVCPPLSFEFATPPGVADLARS